MRRLAWTVLLALGACAAPETPPAPAKPEPPRVSARFRAVPLWLAARDLAAQAGRAVLVAPSIAEDKVAVGLERVTFEDAVASIASAAGADLVALSGGTLAIEAPARVTISDGNDADVRTVLQLLSTYVSEPILVAPGVVSTPSPPEIDLRDVDWREALVRIARAHGLVVARGEGAIVVSRRPLPWAREPLSGAAPVERPAAADLARALEPVAVDWDGATLEDGARDLSRLGPCAVSIDGSVEDSERLRARARVPWIDAVELVARAARRRIEVEKGAVVLRQPEPPGPSFAIGRTPARSCLDMLARLAKVDVELAPEVRGELAPISLVASPLAALRIVALASGFTVQEAGGRLRIDVDPGERAAVLAELEARRAPAPPSAAKPQPDLAELERRARHLLEVVAGLAGDTSDEEITAALHELDLLVREVAPAREIALRALQRLVERRALVGSRAAATYLILWQAESDRLLAELAALSPVDEKKIAATLERAAGHARELRARAEADDERSAADKLIERAKEIEAAHAKSRRIAALGPLEVTALVDGATGLERAIVNGIVVKTGDGVPGADGKPIAGSRVLAIREHGVRLEIGDLDVERAVQGE